jgi:hypothetical protein
LWSIGCSILLLAGSAAAGANAAGDTEGEPERLTAAQAVPLTEYRAYRRMHAGNEKFNQEAWLEAWTELDERGFHYQIVVERGSEYVRNKVLREILKREQQLIASGGAGRAEFTDANYVFEDAERHGPGVRYVLLKPKRKDVLLVDGRMVLNQEGSELLRAEGRLSKNPSFWTTAVNIIRDFARLDGVRVPIATETIAKLRFAGLSRMQVEYEYESINGRPVSLAARRTLAAAAAGR